MSVSHRNTENKLTGIKQPSMDGWMEVGWWVDGWVGGWIDGFMDGRYVEGWMMDG